MQPDERLEGYNLPERVSAILAAAADYAAVGRGDDVLLLMGTDFCYSNAVTWYKNLDYLIAAINADGRATAFYSTPIEYFAAKAAETEPWPLKVDDHFPYADSPGNYWTGVPFSSNECSSNARM